MSFVDQNIYRTQHIALHTPKREIFKDQKSKLHKLNQISHKSVIVCENTRMKRILLVKTSSLGDVVHNLPVVNDLLKHYPSAKIDWVVEESFSAIPKLHPNVNQVITVAIRRWRKHLFKRNTWQEISAYKKQVRQHQYDLIIDSQGLIKSALFQSFARGISVGHSFASAREKIASFFYRRKYYVSKSKHAVDRNRLLIAKALGYKVAATLPDYGIEVSSPSKLTLPEQFVIGLHGTSKDSKLWPTEHWINLAHLLAGEGYVLVLPWGNQKEEMRANQIAAQTNNSQVLPRCEVDMLAKVIAKATAAVGVDTGLSHLACALGKPIVGIYTDTEPARTGIHAGINTPVANLGGTQEVPEVEATFKQIKAFLPT